MLARRGHVMFSESLTVRLLGDSSQLQGELQSVESRLDDLARRISQVQTGFERAGRSASGLGAAQQPLQGVSRAIDQVVGKLDQLSRMSVSLNVSPALNALNTLSQSIAQVASQLASLFVPSLPMGPLPAGPMPVRQFASGGYVLGPSGGDRIPALLSAGEYVLQASAVERLGLQVVESLNQGMPRGQSGSRAMDERSPTAINNHFGGITIAIQQTAELSGVLGSVQAEQERLRLRRG